MGGLNVPFGILQRISEFLADLPEEQISALAEGRARLAYVPEDSEAPAPRRLVAARKAAKPAPALDPAELLDQLAGVTTREQAEVVLAGLKKPALQAVAKALSVPGAAKLTIDDLRAEIVQATVGSRLDSIAIRGFAGDRP